MRGWAAVWKKILSQLIILTGSMQFRSNFTTMMNDSTKHFRPPGHTSFKLQLQIQNIIKAVYITEFTYFRIYLFFPVTVSHDVHICFSSQHFTFYQKLLVINQYQLSLSANEQDKNLINFEDFLKPRKFVSQRHKLR